MTTLAMLGVALSLGVWQLQRLGWKQAILSDIDRGEAGSPTSLSDHPSSFQRVTVAGSYLSGAVRYGAEVRASGGAYTMGAHLVSVLRTEFGDVVVDRGWAPEGFDSMPPRGDVALVGYVRPPEATPRFGASNDLAGRRFFSLDPEAIGLSLGHSRVLPFTVVALATASDKQALPLPAYAMPRPANNHLAYALTWFALAAALVAVFAVFARNVLRSDASGA